MLVSASVVLKGHCQFWCEHKGEVHLNSLIQGGHGKVVAQKEIVAENYYMRKVSWVGWNLGQILEKVQNCLKHLAKISKKIGNFN